MGLLGTILKLASSRKLRQNIRKAEAGDPRAQHRLGFNYSEGNGIPQNHAEAAKWYRKAAEQNYSTAQLNLGFLLQEGRGVEQDLTEAYKWTYLARLHPMGWIERDAAIQHLDQLCALMTPGQITEGERLASQFAPAQSKQKNCQNPPESSDSPYENGFS